MTRSVRYPAGQPEHRRRLRPAHRHSPAFSGRAALADRDAVRLAAAAAVHGLGGRAVHPRRRHLGHQHPRQLGLCDPQLCLVARHRPCRHADLGAAAADAERVAQLAQPVRRNHDAVRGGLRRHLSGAASRPALVSLLDVSLSGDHGRVAAIPQPAGMGHLGGPDLSHRIARLLVHRPHSRSRRGARPRHQTRLADLLRHHLARLARLGGALAALVAGLSADRGTCRAARRLRAQRSLAAVRGGANSRLAFDDLPALFRAGRGVLRLCGGLDHRDRAALVVRSRRISSPTIISTCSAWCCSRPA